ncbi:hypothetical protein QC762_0001080 [Podospora pseudocomata]|uniref:Uncharacterized protein n=1 Tax=Podospora pseudocomata TaxID=2093779 RepID=A0ABR0GSD8_9PEZI|nr:hypothetical protein QC762_0001080 [Podospora pseudocomata]
MRFAGCYGDNPPLEDLIIPVPSVACDERDVPIRSMEHEGDHAFKPRAGAGRFAELVASQFDSSPAQKHDTRWAGSWTEAAKNASEAIKAGFISTTQSRNDYSQKRGFRNSPYPR